MDEVKPETRIRGLAPWWSPGLVAAGAVLVAAAFTTLALFDRAVGGILFLAGLSLILDGSGQFHPLFGLLFPLLVLIAAVTDASRGLFGATIRWFLGAGVIFALGRVLRGRRVGPRVEPNPALEALTAELAALKARRDRGEISEDEFRGRREAAVAAFRQGSSQTQSPSVAEKS